MFSLRSLLLVAPLAAFAYAQKVAFTSLPATLSVGDSFNITWAGGDGSSVALTLRRGNPNDLSTVNIIAGSVTGYWYNWQVPQTLESGSDYALQITQGQSDINWTGLFSIQGASASNSSTTAAATSTQAGNSTMSMTSLASGASASGGMPMSRNVTFSSASLTASSDSGAFTVPSSTSSRTSSTRTASSSASATSAPSNDASAMAGSSAALVMGLVAAIMLH